jgi:hypothetical protein
VQHIRPTIGGNYKNYVQVMVYAMSGDETGGCCNFLQLSMNLAEYSLS